MKKNNKITIFINGWNEEINSEDVQLITSGKSRFSINNSDIDIKNYLIYINDAESFQIRNNIFIIIVLTFIFFFLFFFLKSIFRRYDTNIL